LDQSKRSLRIASFLSGSALAFGFAHWLGVVDLSIARPRARAPVYAQPDPTPPRPKAQPVVIERAPDPDLDVARSAPSIAREGRRSSSSHDPSSNVAASPAPASSPWSNDRDELTSLLAALKAAPQDGDRRVAFEEALARAAERLRDKRSSIAVKRCITQAGLTPDGARAATILAGCKKRFDDLAKDDR
jgi:hypothetical protein